MSQGFAVDGMAIAASAIAKVAEPNVTFERDELQRKLDMREIEMTRKEKELQGSCIEMMRLQKENKIASAEIQNLRDRNETLQQSLMNSRLLSQNARNDAEHVLNESRIRELESALSAAIHKIKKSDAELTNWQEKWKDVDSSYTHAMAELNSIKDTKNFHRAELDMAYAKVKAAQLLIDNYESEADRMRNEIGNARSDILTLRGTIDEKQKDLNMSHKDLAEAKSDVSKLKAVLSVRSETNGVLRQQLEEMNGNSFVISKAEMEKFKRIEREFGDQAQKIKNLDRSLLLQMDISTKAEITLEEMRERVTVAEDKFSSINIELLETRKKIGSTGDREKILKREVIKLRKEKADIVDELMELQNDPFAGDEEIKKMREILAGTSKAKQEEFEEKVKEARKRKLAEESLSALRNRIAFLLEQQEQSSILAAQWQEQKSVFKSEIEALHDINNGLRYRLSKIQGEFVSRHIPKVVNAYEKYDESGDRAFEESKAGDSERLLLQGGNVLSGKSNRGLDSLGEPFDQSSAHAFPVSIESFVERSLFDTICAFSSGKRSQPATARKGGGDGFKMAKVTMIVKKPAFIVQHKGRDDTKVEIGLTSQVTAKGKEVEEAAASELLVGTQINAFLNFCQSRPPNRVASLWAEKVCALLNFQYNFIQDMTDQLGSARLDLSQATSRVAVMDQRMQDLRLKFSLERTAKQKNALKYVREQMRISDIRVLMEDLRIKAGDQREEMEMSGLAFLDNNKNTMSVLHEIEQVGKELSLAGASSGTVSGGVGALEIRLPESEIDDETLHSLVSLLAGGLEEAKVQDDEGQLHNEDGTTTEKEMCMSGSTMMHSKVLSKAIRAITKNYMERLVMINLKGNRLTDTSCKSLGRLIEHSPQIRMIDLRENQISDEGAKALFDAVRKNQSIMYVTQRQNGFMIEGHREIQGGERKPSNGTEETRAEMDRLLDGPKFPMRVDIRYNAIKTEQMEDMFEQVDYSLFQQQQANKDKIQVTEEMQKTTGQRGYPPSLKHPYAYSESPRGTPQKYSTATLTDSPYKDSHHKGSSVQAAKMNASRVTWSAGGMVKSTEFELKQNARKTSAVGDMNNSVKAGTLSNGHPPRPQSTSAGGSRTALGARSTTLEWQDNEDGPMNSEKAGHVGEDHSGLINLIEGRDGVSSVNASGDAGSLVDSKLRGKTTGNIGTLIDGEIREMVSSGHDRGQTVDGDFGGGTGGGAKKKNNNQNVKERILSGTKRIYNNKNMFKEMGEQDTLLDIMKRQNNTNRKDSGRESTIPAALEKGGGQISVNTASSVRTKLSKAKKDGEVLHERKLPKANKIRPSSAPSTGRKKPSNNQKEGKEIAAQAKTLMSTLQKLNPAVLF